MVLGWKQPDKTGGAEITGYYVNYREVIDGVPGRWREANIKAISDEAYKVSVWPSVCFPSGTSGKELPVQDTYKRRRFYGGFTT